MFDELSDFEALSLAIEYRMKDVTLPSELEARLSEQDILDLYPERRVAKIPNAPSGFLGLSD